MAESPEERQWTESEVDAMERALLEYFDEDDAMTAIQILRPWLTARSPLGGMTPTHFEMARREGKG